MNNGRDYASRVYVTAFTACSVTPNLCDESLLMAFSRTNKADLHMDVHNTSISKNREFFSVISNSNGMKNHFRRVRRPLPWPRSGQEEPILNFYSANR